jgi:hypothetical protein
MSYDCEISPDENNILQLQRVPLVAYMSKIHLAKKDKLEAEELRASRVMVVRSPPGTGTGGVAACTRYPPAGRQYARDGGATSATSLNKGILLRQYFLKTLDRPDRGSVEASTSTSGIWKKQNTSPF